MNIEILKSIIIEGQELLEKLMVLPRAFEFEDHARYVFVGVRQAGKSYLLYLRALQLIAQGHSLREILIINFDDERLIGLKAEELDVILQAYSALYENRPILFLDEIQNVVGWEHFARRLANYKYQVYITGSNAKMLSKEIASRLGGRYIEKMVFPFSFREFLAADGINVIGTDVYGKTKGELDRQLAIYFQWGGFPEARMYVNKRQWLNELYEKIILGDIMLRNGIRNEMAMRLTLRRLAENIKTPTSYNRLANIVKAAGCTITPTSVGDYIRYCREGCLLFELENYASKFVERATVRKHYFIDNGLLNIFLSDSETSLLENLCALTLYRKSKKEGGEKVYFYNKECEIDFYLPDSGKAIQASYSISEEATKAREKGALLAFHRRYGLKEAEIVTYSEEDSYEYPGLTIKVIPLAKWLLLNE